MKKNVEELFKMKKNKTTEGIIMGTAGRGMSFSSKRHLLASLSDRVQYVPSDSEEDSWTDNAKEAILFEIFKRFENRTNFPSGKFTSGPEDLKKYYYGLTSAK